MCSVKKVFLKISQNLQKNTCPRASVLIKLRACFLFKKSLWHRCFPVNFANFKNFKNTFSYRTLPAAASEKRSNIINGTVMQIEKALKNDCLRVLQIS